MRHKKIFWLWSVVSAVAVVYLCSSANFDFFSSPVREEVPVAEKRSAASEKMESSIKKEKKKKLLFSGSFCHWMKLTRSVMSMRSMVWLLDTICRNVKSMG